MENMQITTEERLLALLLSKKMTVTTAESCTGGLIASRIVNVPGSSAALMQGLVTYSNEAKMRYLGVREETLRAHGAVSEETAFEMASLGAKNAGTDVCIASTGIAGPGGATPGKPVGLVYIAAAVGEKCTVKKLQLSGSRREIREQAAEEALLLAIELLQDTRYLKSDHKG